MQIIPPPPKRKLLPGKPIFLAKMHIYIIFFFLLTTKFQGQTVSVVYSIICFCSMFNNLFLKYIFNNLSNSLGGVNCADQKNMIGELTDEI